MISPAKYIGQLLTVTGPDKGQCSAVAHAFERDNGLPIVYGNALDTYANAASSKAYVLVPYTQGMTAPAGSIAVWNGTWGNGDGHTAYVESADASGFTAISQNDPTGSRVIRKRYSYSNALIGFFYPKGGNMATDALTNAEAQQIYNFVTVGDGAPQNLLDAWTGRPLGEYLRWLAADPSIRDRIAYYKGLEQEVNAQATQLKPGLYKV